MTAVSSSKLAVVGLWHLGTTITASWLTLGYRLAAIDSDAAVVEMLTRGEPPVNEPGIAAALRAGLSDGRLTVTTDVAMSAIGRFCFIAHDTPLDTAGAPLIESVARDLIACAPYLGAGSLIVVSAQVPVGTTRDLRARARAINPEVEIVYVPENVVLGTALDSYLHPNHIVVGSVTSGAAEAVAALFRPMDAEILHMSLESAEMVKHARNSMLATSVSLANHFSDICTATGAEYSDVARALRADPRIGPNAYLNAGTGFAGGTLGRDLRVLDRISRERLNGTAPLFGEVLRYNDGRVGQLADGVINAVPREGKVCLLGATYKAGTSTLRRSQTLQLARRLISAGRRVSAHDPAANWSEEPLPDGLVACRILDEAARDADMLVLMTEWPEYQALDPNALRDVVRRARLLDPKGFLRRRARAFTSSGWEISFSISPLPSWTA